MAHALCPATYRRFHTSEVSLARERILRRDRSPNSTEVKGTLIGTDGKQEHFQVDDLQTALGTYPAATLRATDLLYVEAPISAREVAALLSSPPHIPQRDEVT